MRLNKFLCAAVLIGAAGLAYAQSGGPFTAPSLEYFIGPSGGKQYYNANSFSGGVNSQTGTSYTFVASDRGKLIVFNNASAVAVTLPAASSGNGFGAASHWSVLNLGAGTVTITPTTSTINGSTTKTYAQNASGEITTDGTNYFAY